MLGSLVVAVAAAGVFILLPLLFRRDASNGGGAHGGAVGRFLPFVYFACLGLGFLWVEIPLLQRFILYLDQPTYAFATVLFGVLVWSGVGSLASDRLRVSLAATVSAVVVLSVLYAFGLPLLFDATLGLPLQACPVILLALSATTMPSLAPSECWEGSSPGPVNAASVVSAILATILALSFGFTWVCRGGSISRGCLRGSFPEKKPR